MQLTGKMIVDGGSITGVCKEGIQQQGVDVRLARVFVLEGTGEIPAEGKTILPRRHELPAVTGSVLFLQEGYYEIEFFEGCDLKADQAMYFKTRSSLVRCGAIIHSGQFDGGFNTDHMGAFLEVKRPIRIEIGARVAQAIVNETYEVQKEYMYDGQYQNDKQRAPRPAEQKG